MPFSNYSEFAFKGGYDGEAIARVLAWDPLEEKWLNAGNLSIARLVFSPLLKYFSQDCKCAKTILKFKATFISSTLLLVNKV